MNKLTGIITALTFVCGLFISASAQDTTIRAMVFTGDVTKVTDTELVIKTNTGDMSIQLSGQTTFKRVRPEAPTDLANALPAERSEIGLGDKLVVTGIPSNDRKTLPARAVYLMTQSDISKRNQAEAARWATRGISGRVVSVDKEKNEITVSLTTLTGSSNITLSPKSDAVIRKYAPDSIKFNEAVSSSLDQIRDGDSLRAVGDRSSDGQRFTAEEIITGAFQTVAGTIKSIDADNNAVVITEMGTDNEITVTFGSNSALRKFTPEMARMMMMMAMGGQGGIPGAPGAGGQRPAGAGAPAAGGQGGQRPSGGQAQAGQAGQGGQRPGGAGQGGQAGQRPGMGGMGAARSGGIDDIFERLPVIQASELAVGEMIAVSSSKNGSTERIRAIKLIAGIEPFVTAAQMAGGARRMGRGGQDTGFQIPGLDGFDF